MKKNLLLFIFLCVGFLVSCTTSKMSKTNSFLPDIHQPSYEAYTSPTERGYILTFEIEKDKPQPVAVIFNKIKKKISTAEYANGHYNVHVIANTTLIPDYKAEGSTLPNGILFYYDGVYYLKEVNFKQKK